VGVSDVSGSSASAPPPSGSFSGPSPVSLCSPGRTIAPCGLGGGPWWVGLQRHGREHRIVGGRWGKGGLEAEFEDAVAGLVAVGEVTAHGLGQLAGHGKAQSYRTVGAGVGPRASTPGVVATVAPLEANVDAERRAQGVRSQGRADRTCADDASSGQQHDVVEAQWGLLDVVGH